MCVHGDCHVLFHKLLREYHCAFILDIKCCVTLVFSTTPCSLYGTLLASQGYVVSRRVC